MFILQDIAHFLWLIPTAVIILILASAFMVNSKGRNKREAITIVLKKYWLNVLAFLLTAVMAYIVGNY